jgi:hypothetical protein
MVSNVDNPDVDAKIAVPVECSSKNGVLFQQLQKKYAEMVSIVYIEMGLFPEEGMYRGHVT